jgi:lipopolysaccharide export system permease protein
MRLLDRYLLRELIIPFGYCLSGFLVFWISTDLISQLDDLHRHKLHFSDVLIYYAVKIPEMLVLVLPIALLLALLYALTTHSRYNELTAIRAAGVSLWRLALPYLAVGFLFSLVLLAVNELWVPRSTEAAEKILNQYETPQTNAPSSHWIRDFGFTNTRQRRKWFIKAYNLATHEMFSPHVEWTLDTGTAWDIYAERAFYSDGGWTFTNVQERIFPAIRGAFPTVNRTNLLFMPEFNETPEEIESEIKIARLTSIREARKAQLSAREILNYRRLHTENNRKTDMLDTKLHERLASPWRALVVVLIALPFGAASGRRNVYAGVASSILICFTYYVLAQVGLALGAGGYVWPALAAWMPNLFFTGLGLFLIYRVR